MSKDKNAPPSPNSAGFNSGEMNDVPGLVTGSNYLFATVKFSSVVLGHRWELAHVFDSGLDPNLRKITSGNNVKKALQPGDHVILGSVCQNGADWLVTRVRFPRMVNGLLSDCLASDCIGIICQKYIPPLIPTRSSMIPSSSDIRVPNGSSYDSGNLAGPVNPSASKSFDSPPKAATAARKSSNSVPVPLPIPSDVFHPTFGGGLSVAERTIALYCRELSQSGFIRVVLPVHLATSGCYRVGRRFNFRAVRKSPEDPWSVEAVRSRDRFPVLDPGMPRYFFSGLPTLSPRRRRRSQRPAAAVGAGRSCSSLLSRGVDPELEGVAELTAVSAFEALGNCHGYPGITVRLPIEVFRAYTGRDLGDHVGRGDLVKFFGNYIRLRPSRSRSRTPRAEPDGAGIESQIRTQEADAVEAVKLQNVVGDVPATVMEVRVNYAVAEYLSGLPGRDTDRIFVPKNVLEQGFRRSFDQVLRPRDEVRMDVAENVMSYLSDCSWVAFNVRLPSMVGQWVDDGGAGPAERIAARGCLGILVAVCEEDLGSDTFLTKDLDGGANNQAGTIFCKGLGRGFVDVPHLPRQLHDHGRRPPSIGDRFWFDAVKIARRKGVGSTPWKALNLEFDLGAVIEEREPTILDRGTGRLLSDPGAEILPEIGDHDLTLKEDLLYRHDLKSSYLVNAEVYENLFPCRQSTETPAADSPSESHFNAVGNFREFEISDDESSDYLSSSDNSDGYEEVELDFVALNDAQNGESCFSENRQSFNELSNGADLPYRSTNVAFCDLNTKKNNNQLCSNTLSLNASVSCNNNNRFNDTDAVYAGVSGSQNVPNNNEMSSYSTERGESVVPRNAPHYPSPTIGNRPVCGFGEEESSMASESVRNSIIRGQPGLPRNRIREMLTGAGTSNNRMVVQSDIATLTVVPKMLVSAPPGFGCKPANGFVGSLLPQNQNPSRPINNSAEQETTAAWHRLRKVQQWLAERERSKKTPDCRDIGGVVKTNNDRFVDTEALLPKLRVNRNRLSGIDRACVYFDDPPPGLEFPANQCRDGVTDVGTHGERVNFGIPRKDADSRFWDDSVESNAQGSSMAAGDVSSRLMDYFSDTSTMADLLSPPAPANDHNCDNSDLRSSDGTLWSSIWDSGESSMPRSAEMGTSGAGNSSFCSSGNGMRAAPGNMVQQPPDGGGFFPGEVQGMLKLMVEDKEMMAMLMQRHPREFVDYVSWSLKSK